MSLDELLRNQELPLVIDFYASWCVPCRQLAEDIESLTEEFQAQIQFARVDIDASPELAERFDIGTVPTLLALSQGWETTRLSGKISTQELRSFLTSLTNKI